MNKKQYVKYSIQDRQDYYGKYPITDDNKSRFAVGYYQVLKSGKLPKNINKYNKVTVLGMHSALNALSKSRKIKF